MVAFGKGVNGGKVHGQWLGLAPDKLFGPGDLNITTDYRDVLGEVVEKRLKNPRLSDLPELYRLENLGVVQG